MDDFDKHFNRVDEMINKGFDTGNRYAKIAIVGVIGGWIVGIGVLGFVGWVIVKILQSQGII